MEQSLETKEFNCFANVLEAMCLKKINVKLRFVFCLCFLLTAQSQT